ncbi:hypothetical protein FOA52_010259 [Chlamydomonas sp. UWO 241]|nr:hypothetical protein FOA52_010259 [Chlamydomonas sp. UWO 241]
MVASHHVGRLLARGGPQAPLELRGNVTDREGSVCAADAASAAAGSGVAPLAWSFLTATPDGWLGFHLAASSSGTTNTAAGSLLPGFACRSAATASTSAPARAHASEGVGACSSTRRLQAAPFAALNLARAPAAGASSSGGGSSSSGVQPVGLGFADGAAVADAGTAEVSGLQLWLQQQFLKLPLLRSLAAPLASRAVAGGEEPLAVDKQGAAASSLDRSPVMPVINRKRQQRLKPPAKLSPEDRHLWDLFREIDVNGDGGIDFNEMQYALSKLHLPMYPRTIVSAMRQFEGTDSNDKVTWEQFRSYVSERDSGIRTAFSNFDTDYKGRINARELAQVMTVAGLPSTGRDMQKVLEAMGKHASDTLTYPEFRNFVCLMPGWKFHGGAYASFNNYAQWLRSGEASRNCPERIYTTVSTPLQHYVVFDLFLRGSIAGSLLLALVMASNTD